MKLKNCVAGQRVRIKDLNERTLVRYGHFRHYLRPNDVLECTHDGLDEDKYVRLVSTDGEEFYYYTKRKNLRKVKH
mgnify:CR=1 FL=1